jgi:TetR/AcrR family transcriptional regulator, regulator of cefoperazone and chloramphenicol sensitivity
MGQSARLELGTRDRILEAAGEVFAESGFRGATVRKICDRAAVNVSAIKYHFGGKEDLYSEVLRYWHEFAIKKYPPLLGVGQDGSPEDQLRAFIRSFMFRMLDRGKPAWFGKVMAREMAEPTRAFDRLVSEVMGPLNKLLTSIIRKIIGPRADQETLRLCCASILGQCAYYCNARLLSHFFKRDLSNPDEIERIADHIARFSAKSLDHYLRDDGDRDRAMKGRRDDSVRLEKAGDELLSLS